MSKRSSLVRSKSSLPFKSNILNLLSCLTNSNTFFPKNIIKSLIRIFELHSFPHKQHHKKKLKTQSKEILLQAVSEITKYSNNSYEDVIEQIYIEWHNQ